MAAGGRIGSAVSTSPLTEFAPAKVNLALHVTGRRADGYHLLDSLVVFASLCDRLSFERADTLSLTVDGPRASGVPVAENLVLKAAEVLRRRVQRPDLGAAIRLEKYLPAAAGIGGGSADAAATLRGLNRLWQLRLSSRVLAELGAGLGADVPVCVHGQAARVEGIGETVTPLANFPPLWLLLINPGLPVPTAAVFSALQNRENAPLPALPHEFSSPTTLVQWLAATRNDLQPAATAFAPAIAQVLEAIAGAGDCLLARMSGSGATCFGIFADRNGALAAGRAILAQHPNWWCEAGATTAA